MVVNGYASQHNLSLGTRDGMIEIQRHNANLYAETTLDPGKYMNQKKQGGLCLPSHFKYMDPRLPAFIDFYMSFIASL